MATPILDTYLANMKFKKRKFGGVDEIDAINHLDELSKRYEQEIARVNLYWQQVSAELEQTRQSLNQAYAEINSLSEQNNRLQQSASQGPMQSGVTERLLRDILVEVQRVEQRLSARSAMYVN